MTSVNKLSLKEFVKTEQPPKLYPNDNTHQPYHLEQKDSKVQRRSSARQNKKLKLNTLPCQHLDQDQDPNQKFLFRSTWEDDNQHFKQQMKGCTSPTFATEILSNVNHSSLFPSNDQVNEQTQECSRRTRGSNSRSKSKHNKSIQKFIGDNVSTHRQSQSTVQHSIKPLKQEKNNQPVFNSPQQQYLYEIKRLQSLNQELKRQNKKMEQKYQQIKEKCNYLQEQQNYKVDRQQKDLMTNQELLEKMKNESFWKFYIKAEKMIKASLAQNNLQQQVISSPINFMKQLQALREMTSQMKKQNKMLKKTCDEKSEQTQLVKDKLNVQQAQVEEMRLKCVAYESGIKKLKDELGRKQKELEKLGEVKELENKLAAKSQECVGLVKQVNSLTQQLEEQQILNTECEKQRVSTKKKCQQLNDEITSLNKQLSSLKTSYNLLEIQKQQLSANKKQLIEKERLKQKVHQLEKQLKSITMAKEQQTAKLRVELESRFGQEIQIKDSRVKELDQKVEQIMNTISELREQNSSYSEANQQLKQQVEHLQEENSQLVSEVSQTRRELSTSREQKESRLSELSKQLQSLTCKLNQQSLSLLSQQKMIQELKREISEKQELLRVKEYESQKLKASLMMIQEEENSSRSQHTEQLSRQSRNQQQTQQQQQQRQRQELEQYVAKLQQKHNQALQLYETVHNQKVELELQLHCYEQEIQKLNSYLQNLPNHQQPLMGSQDTLELIDSLLTIKEEIIKKILVFCPTDFKQLLVEYIYYGDMIKEKYIEIINCHVQQQQQVDNNNENQFCVDDDDESYLQLEDNPKSNFYHQTQTRRNHYTAHSKEKYNKTKPYPNTVPGYEPHTPSQHDQSQIQDQDNIASKQQQINQLLEQFIKIGNIIEQQTRQSSQSIQPARKTQLSRQKEEQFRRSKQKEIQQSKHVLNQINQKINQVKQANFNDENSLHYKLTGNFFENRQSSKNPQQCIQDQNYPAKQLTKNHRQPLQPSQQRQEPNISRPLFTANIKLKNPNIRNQYQQDMGAPKGYEELRSVPRSNRPIEQTPMQKGGSNMVRNNFNHGVMNKFAVLKMADKIRQ